MLPNERVVADEEANLWLTHVPLDLASLPARLEVCDLVWRRKDELHVTLVNGPSASKAVRERLGVEDGRGSVRHVVEQWRRFPPVHFQELRPDFRRVRLGASETLIVMCTIAGHGALVARVSAELGVPLEVPTAHITLYTRGEPIGIANERELNERTLKLTDQEAQALAIAVRAAMAPAP